MAFLEVSAGWMMTDSAPPHLDLSRLLLMANHPTVVSHSAFLPSLQAGAWRLQLGGYIYNKGYASHWRLAIYIKKYLKGKRRRIMETQIFRRAKKNPLKETKILQDIITLQLISSFNTSQNIIFQKSSYKNRPIIIKLLYSIMNLNTISLSYHTL